MKNLILLLLVAVVTQFTFSSCNDDKENVWVDLRYNPQDYYELGHTSPEEIVFEVSSTMDWRIYGTANWYSIDPSQGAAGEIYKVTIKATNNTALDDRKDTVTIQSDYWIGKKFVVFQKGTAFITLDDSYTFSEEGGVQTIQLKSNQDWSLKVTSGNEWLSVVNGESGSLDGEFTLQTIVNKGERRAGELSVYDRNGKLYSTIRIIQDGVTLEPTLDRFRVPKQAGVYNLDVESNTEWKISKPDNITWISFNETTFSGDATVEINYLENTGSTVRTVQLTLETTGTGDDIEPVVKTIMLKQAPTINYSITEFDEGKSWGQWTSLKHINDGSDIIVNVPGGAEDRCRTYIDREPLGIYSFNIKRTSMTAADQSQIYIGLLFASDSYAGYTYEIYSNSRITVTTPSGSIETDAIYDLSVPHTVAVSIAQENGNLVVEWWLDDVVIATYVDTQLKPMVPQLTLLLGYENASWYPGNSIPSAEKGVTFDSWGYASPLDWGE